MPCQVDSGDGGGSAGDSGDDDVLTAAMAMEVKVETTEPAKMAERLRS